MVTYCEKCGSSLPFADILIKNGKEINAPGYKCPDCGYIIAEVDDSVNNIDDSKKIKIKNDEEEIEDIEEDKNTNT